jgi:uncharacterized protein (TIGR02265 family)
LADHETILGCADFAERVTRVAADREAVERNLLAFPPSIEVRGLFFNGLARLVEEARGAGAVAVLRQHGGVQGKTTAFHWYPHRDFYKSYYLAASLLYPRLSMAGGLRQIARSFFPIFKASLLGGTMSALMGDRPFTILPLLARAYNISVKGNEHETAVDGERALVWRCVVEPVDWYPETFGGIVEGAMPDAFRARVSVEEHAADASSARYCFRISW